MRLRTTLLIGILVILLLQITLTGTFTLTSFLLKTRSSMDSDLVGDWDRARAYLEELKHRLYTDLYQLRLFLAQSPDDEPASSLKTMMSSFITLTNADRIVLVDEPGQVLVDERAGVDDDRAQLPVTFLNPRDFTFPRNQFVTMTDAGGSIHLYLVTGMSVAREGGGIRHVYLVTDMDKSMVEAIWEKTATEVAFFVGTLPVASATPWQPFDTDAPPGSHLVRIGDTPYSVYSRPLSADVPARIYLVAFRSMVAERLYVRSVLLSYLTAFLVALAASVFLAAGFMGLVISPFTRLSAWLHRYMDTGEVSKLDVKSRNEIGFLAETFHEMVSTLIGEKQVITDQLDQISVLNAYNERIMNAIPAGIIVTGPDGTIEFCNGYFADLVSSNVGELRGSDLRSIMAARFTWRSGETDGTPFFEAGTNVTAGLRLQRDGESLHFTAKASAIALAGGRHGSLIVLEDISTSERFWSKMTVADRVTSLGILSAGMAHEINNPLGAILAHVTYLKAVETEKDKRDSLDWIEAETNRIAGIIKRIRVYTAPEERSEPFSDLNLVVRETGEILRFTFEKKKILFGVSLGDLSAQVVCPPDELKQVVLNILLNACDACDEEGRITLSTSCNGDGLASLVIADNGSGIDPQDMKHVFDPFFTTKAATQGNGLGLSICYAIVKRAGGDIRVTSAPGRGTEVEVMLRVHERPDHR